SQSPELTTKTSSESLKKTPLIKTTSVETYKHTPLHSTMSSEPWSSHTLLQGKSSIETSKLHTSTASPNLSNSISEASHVQTSSAVNTLIPQKKAGFSSITISSRKVTRSSSLPNSNIPNCVHTNHTRDSPSPPPTHHSMDTLQRKATIVKVTEHRITSGPTRCAKQTENSPANHALDTVVHRRKATIIKVTEHREHYSPARTAHPEYRHSYTDGTFRENSMWNQGSLDHTPSHHHLGSPERPNSAVSPNTSNSVVLKEPEKSGRTLHRSTLSLVLGNPPAIAAPPPTEVSPKPLGQRSDRPGRPLSCYGNLFGHTESSKKNATQPNARKWSFGLPQQTNVNSANSGRSFIKSGIAVKEAGQTLKPNGDENERQPQPQDEMRRASPSLTLIKAPEPNSQQSAEEVLALNAAAIIANIKLQRQLSKKKTPHGNSEKDSIASPQGNIDVGKHIKPYPDQRLVQQQKQPPAEFVPLKVDPDRPAKTVSLQVSF
ncbi:hypothetical protein LDENG_00086240, partial [Lucifuga dentata]